MTDQIPADKARKLAARFRQQMEPHTPAAECEVWECAAEAVEALLPPPTLPTLADMTPEARRDCQWMQADTKPWGRVVIIVPDLSDGRAALLDIWGDVAYEDHTDVTPRPDLPRMEWPGTEKPAPALPEGWRLADHQKYGRVIVTTPARDGRAYYVLPAADHLGFDWLFCTPDELTYIDQEADQ